MNLGLNYHSTKPFEHTSPVSKYGDHHVSVFCFILLFPVLPVKLITFYNYAVLSHYNSQFSGNFLGA